MRCPLRAGPSGASIRDICKLTGADVKSWTAAGDDKARRRGTHARTHAAGTAHVRPAASATSRPRACSAHAPRACSERRGRPRRWRTHSASFATGWSVTRSCARASTQVRVSPTLGRRRQCACPGSLAALRPPSRSQARPWGASRRSAACASATSPRPATWCPLLPPSRASRPGVGVGGGAWQRTARSPRCAHPPARPPSAHPPPAARSPGAKPVPHSARAGAAALALPSPPLAPRSRRVHRRGCPRSWDCARAARPSAAAQHRVPSPPTPWQDVLARAPSGASRAPSPASALARSNSLPEAAREEVGSRPGSSDGVQAPARAQRLHKNDVLR